MLYGAAMLDDMPTWPSSIHFSSQKSGICYLRGFCGDVTSHKNQEFPELPLFPKILLLFHKLLPIVPLYWGTVTDSDLVWIYFYLSIYMYICHSSIYRNPKLVWCSLLDNDATVCTVFFSVCPSSQVYWSVHSSESETGTRTRCGCGNWSKTGSNCW